MQYDELVKENDRLQAEVERLKQVAHGFVSEIELKDTELTKARELLSTHCPNISIGVREFLSNQSAPDDKGRGEPVASIPEDWLTLAQKFQEVGLAYWKSHNREQGPGAVKWLHNEETGALLVVTRGEYSQELKDFIHGLDLPPQQPAR